VNVTREEFELDLKQPLLGIAATAIVILISMAFISLFDFPTFAGWVSYGLLAIIPMVIVVGITWGSKQPAFAASQPQPVRGILLVLVTIAAGLVVGPVYFATVGGSIGPPTPMLMHAGIVSVVVTFWFAVMWGGWPFSLIKNPIAAGLTMLFACYVVNFLLFRLFFNYAFMEGAVPPEFMALDPGGLFNGVSAMVFYVTAVGIMFLTLNFDLWPFTLSPAVMQQPVLGVAWTVTAFVLGGGLFYLGTDLMGMDPMKFLITVPIPFIFGTIVVLNMLQGSMFAGMKQPVRGILNTVASAVIGSVLALVYGRIAVTLSGPLAPGPPTYEFEVWLASALLAVTFPFLIFKAEFLGFWPLRKNGESSANSIPAKSG
jgi:hypothetical protein